MAVNGVTGLALGDIDPDGLEQTRILINASIPEAKCLLIHLDVGQESSVNAAVEAAVRRFQRIDYALNCAGIAGPVAPTDQVDFIGWQNLLNVNLNGVWLSQRAEIRQMLKQDARTIEYTLNALCK